MPVFRRALLFPTRVALQDEVGIYTYAGLHQAASALCSEIAAQLGMKHLIFIVYNTKYLVHISKYPPIPKICTFTVLYTIKSNESS